MSDRMNEERKTGTKSSGIVRYLIDFCFFIEVNRPHIKIEIPNFALNSSIAICANEPNQQPIQAQ